MPTPEDPAPSSRSHDHPGRRILVVDDDPAVRDLFRVILHHARFSVEVADSGTAALHRLAKFRPDAITLDLAMPGVDGFSVLDWLRALPSAPPVVIVTGAAYPEEVMSLGPPVVGILIKPPHPGELIAACERALAGSPTSPGAAVSLRADERD
jgi:CheY-like chemotaxis protein